jgi:hypothetical protein
LNYQYSIDETKKEIYRGQNNHQTLNQYFHITGANDHKKNKTETKNCEKRTSIPKHLSIVPKKYKFQSIHALGSSNYRLFPLPSKNRSKREMQDIYNKAPINQ